MTLLFPRVSNIAAILATCFAAAVWPAQGQVVTDSVFRAKQQITLATQYEHGEGLPKDPARAFELYCDAARTGSAEAQFKLGWMVANGRGVPRHNPTAAALFQLAAEQGHEYAAKMLAFVGKPALYLPYCLQPAEYNELPPSLPPQLALMLSLGLSPALSPQGQYQRVDWLKSALWRKPIVDTVKLLAPKYGIDPDFALAIIAIESAFDVNALSNKNAQGLMQLIPDTAKRFAVKDPKDAIDNIQGGLSYLRWLMAAFGGQVEWVAAAYNAGEQAVQNHAGVPPYAETRAYVEKLCRLYPKQSHPFNPKIANRMPLAQQIDPLHTQRFGCVLPGEKVIF
jgi:hypothetical protein